MGFSYISRVKLTHVRDGEKFFSNKFFKNFVDNNEHDTTTLRRDFLFFNAEKYVLDLF